MNYSKEGPRMGFRPGTLPSFFAFGAFQVSFSREQISDDFDLDSEDWNISFDPMEKMINYRTDIKLNRTGMPGRNMTKLFLSFRQDRTEGGRRILYNLTMKENLTMDQVAVKWMFNINREGLERSIKKNISNWGWRMGADRSTLDSDEGKEIARMHWEKIAYFRNMTGDGLLPVRLEQTNTDEDMVLEITMEIGHDAEEIGSGGYLEFLDPFFDLFGTDPEEVEELIRDHFISVLIGAVIASIVIIAIVPLMVKKKVSSDPVKELDYRQSQFFRKD